MFMNPFCGFNALGKQIRWCFNPLSQIYIITYWNTVHLLIRISFLFFNIIN